MRYIGSKENLLPFIDRVVEESGIHNGVFCDLFAGTTAVGRYFKSRGYSVISNDLMHFSYVLGKAYIETCAEPSYADLSLPGGGSRATLQDALDCLNALPPEPGFIHRHYSDIGTRNLPSRRMYFTAENAGRIDAIRNQIAAWRAEGTISDSGFFVLLAALLEAVPGVSNISGTYGAYLKYWEARSHKQLTLEAPAIVPSPHPNHVYAKDGGRLVQEVGCDILYLDPPYNSRQYAPNYHILETVARWDEPAIYGKTGLRPYRTQKSRFCSREKAVAALDEIVQAATCDLLLLSYNSEGIMPDADIRCILRARGPLKVYEQPYRRYRSDSDNENRTYKSHRNVIERIYAVRT